MIEYYGAYRWNINLCFSAVTSPCKYFRGSTPIKFKQLSIVLHKYPQLPLVRHEVGAYHQRHCNILSSWFRNPHNLLNLQEKWPLLFYSLMIYFTNSKLWFSALYLFLSSSSVSSIGVFLLNCDNLWFFLMYIMRIYIHICWSDEICCRDTICKVNTEWSSIIQRCVRAQKHIVVREASSHRVIFTRIYDTCSKLRWCVQTFIVCKHCLALLLWLTCILMCLHMSQKRKYRCVEIVGEVVGSFEKFLAVLFLSLLYVNSESP